MTKDEALKIAIEALAKCKEAYLAGPNWQKVGYDILDKSQQACKEALEQPTLTYEDGFAHGYEAHRAEQALEQPAQEPVSLGDFDNMTKAECVDYIEYLRKEIDLLRFKEWQGLSNDMVRAIGEKCQEENRGILNWIDFYNAIESMLKDKNYE